MARRLLLEGSDVDELLARVRTQHGPDAEIVHAKERLVGGVGGFFARRRYEVAIEVQDDETGAGTGQHGQEHNMSGQGFAGGSPIGATIYDALQDTLRGTPAPASSFEDLLSVADRHDGVGQPVAAAADPALPAKGAVPAKDAVATEDAVFRPAPYVPAAAFAGQPDVAVETGGHRPVSTETPGFEALLRDLMEQRDLALHEMGAAPAAAAVEPAAAPAPAAVPDVPAPAATWQDVPAPEAPFVSEPAVEQLPTRRRASHRSSAPASTAPQALVELGLSPDSPVRAASSDPRTVLLDLLSDVAASARTGLRGTAVLVGPSGPARAVARRLVEETGLSRQSLLVVDLEDEELVVADVLVAAAERCGRHGAAVVVLATGSSRQGGRAAGRLAALLGCGPLTAVVDATRDAEATRSWVEAVAEAGRRVDDLAAFDVTMTPTPLRLLELGHPVSWLDAVPATLGAWAAPCLERLKA